MDPAGRQLIMSFDWDGDRGKCLRDDQCNGCPTGDALLDLHERVSDLEQRVPEPLPDYGPEARRAMAKKMVKDIDLQIQLDELQDRVYEFVRWLDHDEHGVKLDDCAVLFTKLRELGLMTGLPGGAAHPDNDPSSEEKP
jgi:hypothetical protein